MVSDEFSQVLGRSMVWDVTCGLDANKKQIHENTKKTILMYRSTLVESRKFEK